MFFATEYVKYRSSLRDPYYLNRKKKHPGLRLRSKTMPFGFALQTIRNNPSNNSNCYSFQYFSAWLNRAKRINNILSFLSILSYNNFFLLFPILLYIAGYQKEQNNDNTFFFFLMLDLFSWCIEVRRAILTVIVYVENEEEEKKSIIFFVIYIIINNIDNSAKDREGFPHHT